jgi:hypothetical protein
VKIPTIKDLMREQASFVKYEDGKLWYQVLWMREGSLALFDFPIDVSDAGGGAFTTTEKALTLMRWIRKHIEYLTAAQKCDDCGRSDGHDSTCFYHGPY